MPNNLDNMRIEEAVHDFADVIAQEVEGAIGRALAKKTSAFTPGEWLSNGDAMQVLGVSRSTLQRYRTAGRLRYAVIGGRVRYRRTDIEGLMAIQPQDTQTLYQEQSHEN